MDALLLLMPAALILGGIGLAAFFWAVKSDQFEDLDGASQRVLLDDDIANDADDTGGKKEAQDP